MLQVTQEPKIGMITKAFVTLIFVTNIDDLFAQSFPRDILDNAEKLNKAKVLRVGNDDNAFPVLWKRLKKNLMKKQIDVS